MHTRSKLTLSLMVLPFLLCGRAAAQTAIHSDTFGSDTLSSYVSGMTYGSSAGYPGIARANCA